VSEVAVGAATVNDTAKLIAPMFFRVVGDDGKVLWTSGPIKHAEGYGESFA